jgi:hypothetical protein
VEVGLVIDFTMVMSPNNHRGIDLLLMMVGLMEETDQMVKIGGLASTLIEPDKIITFLLLVCTISLAFVLIQVFSFV